MNKLHVTIKYTAYLVVRNVERQNCFPFCHRGCRCFNPDISKADWNCQLLISWIIGLLKLLKVNFICLSFTLHKLSKVRNVQGLHRNLLSKESQRTIIDVVNVCQKE